MLTRDERAWRARGWQRELGIAFGVLALFAALGVGCSGCGSCGSCTCSSCTPLACDPILVDPDAPIIFDGGTDGGRDGGLRDAPFSAMDVLREHCDYVTPGSNIGARCTDSCVAPYECSALAVGMADAERDLTPAFCTSTCSLDEDTCGPCAGCIESVPVGMSRLRLGEGPLDGLCAPRCVPAALDRGTCLPGFTCELTARVCVPACASDVDCALVRGADGLFSALSEGAASCDAATGRCEHPEPPEPVSPMAFCESDLECPATEHCFHDPQWAEGISLCLQLACDLPTRDCDDDRSCRSLREGTACLQTCAGDLDCPAHLRCYTTFGVCWRGCETDGDCAASETCVARAGGACDGVDCECLAGAHDADAGLDVDAGVADETDAGDMDGGTDG